VKTSAFRVRDLTIETDRGFRKDGCDKCRIYDLMLTDSVRTGRTQRRKSRAISLSWSFTPCSRIATLAAGAAQTSRSGYRADFWRAASVC